MNKEMAVDLPEKADRLISNKLLRSLWIASLHEGELIHDDVISKGRIAYLIHWSVHLLIADRLEDCLANPHVSLSFDLSAWQKVQISPFCARARPAPQPSWLAASGGTRISANAAIRYRPS